MLKVGFAKIRITPPLGIIMGGHPGIKKATGVLDDLYTRAMAIENNTQKLVFITADVLFIDNDSVDAIRQAIASKCDVKKEDIFISSTHTHSGPLTTNLFGHSREASYVNEMEELIALVAQTALGGMRPAEIGFARTRFPGYAYNARIVMRGGRVETHPWRWSNDIVGFEGPVDEEVVVIAARDADSRIMGMIVNYANHPQVMERENTLLSADFPGWMERCILEQAKANVKLFCNDIVVIYINGASGNICPVNSCSDEHIEVGEAWAKKMGAALADRSVKTLNSMKFNSDVNIRVAKSIVSLPIRDISQEKLDKARNFLANPPKEGQILKVSNYGVEPPDSDYISLEEYLHTDEWRKQEYTDLLALWEKKQKSPNEEVELAAVGIGNNAIVMAPFELFTELGLEIKEKSTFEITAVAELTNGYSGYLPTKYAFARPGSYETLTLRSSKYAPEACETVISVIMDLLRKIK